MTGLFMNATERTPKVSFDYYTGTLSISGTSIIENAHEFYEPLMKWLDTYLAQPKKLTTLNFHMDYFNTSSSMYMVTMLKRLEELLLNGLKVNVVWLYEEGDEDMHQTGLDIQRITTIPMVFLPKNFSDEP